MRYWIHENETKYPDGLLVHNENCQDRKNWLSGQENKGGNQHEVDSHGPFLDLSALWQDLARLCKAKVFPYRTCGCMSGYYFCKRNNGPHGQVLIHTGICPYCNYGRGTKREASSTKWYGPYQDTETVKREARKQGTVDDCKRCNPTRKETESQNKRQSMTPLDIQ